MTTNDDSNVAGLTLGELKAALLDPEGVASRAASDALRSMVRDRRDRQAARLDQALANTETPDGGEPSHQDGGTGLTPSQQRRRKLEQRLGIR